MKTMEEWIKERQAQGHDVAVVIMDRPTGESILTTLDPVVAASFQHSEGASLIKLKEVGDEKR